VGKQEGTLHCVTHLPDDHLKADSEGLVVPRVYRVMHSSKALLSTCQLSGALASSNKSTEFSHRFFHRDSKNGWLMGRLRWKCTLRRIVRAALGIAVVLAIAGCSDGQIVQSRVVAGADPPDPGPYRIGKGDSLDILVWGREQLSGRLHVGSDGTITIPLVGQTEAAGLTTTDLQKTLTRKLSRFINDPDVTVRVAVPSSEVFYVLGEVKRAGKYQLAPGEVLSQALAEAGGPTEFANLRKVKIIRYAGEKSTELTVNYNALAADGALTADVPISRGDTIVVP
jgi:polysaccharide biosynthesis/export protein